MPYDLALLTKVDKSTLTSAELAAIGNSDYIFEMYSNDIQFDDLGLLLETDSTQKLVQSVLKIILTDTGSGPEDGAYGSILSSLIGQKITQSTFTDITDAVIQSIRHYDDINVDNENSDEYIDTLESVELYKDETDPRRIFVRIKLINESGQEVSVAVGVGS